MTAALGPGAGAYANLGMASGVGAASAMVENIVEQGYNVYDGKQDYFNWKSFFHNGAEIGVYSGGPQAVRGCAILRWKPSAW